MDINSSISIPITEYGGLGSNGWLNPNTSLPKVELNISHNTTFLGSHLGLKEFPKGHEWPTVGDRMPDNELLNSWDESMKPAPVTHHYIKVPYFFHEPRVPTEREDNTIDEHLRWSENGTILQGTLRRVQETDAEQKALMEKLENAVEGTGYAVRTLWDVRHAHTTHNDAKTIESDQLVKEHELYQLFSAPSTPLSTIETKSRVEGTAPTDGLTQCKRLNSVLHTLRNTSRLDLSDSEVVKFTSPLHRTGQTLDEVFEGILSKDSPEIMIEELREQSHTNWCDMIPDRETLRELRPYAVMADLSGDTDVMFHSLKARTRLAEALFKRNPKLEEKYPSLSAKQTTRLREILEERGSTALSGVIRLPNMYFRRENEEAMISRGSKAVTKIFDTLNTLSRDGKRKIGVIGNHGRSGLIRTRLMDQSRLPDRDFETTHSALLSSCDKELGEIAVSLSDHQYPTVTARPPPTKFENAELRGSVWLVKEVEGYTAETTLAEAYQAFLEDVKGDEAMVEATLTGGDTASEAGTNVSESL